MSRRQPESTPRLFAPGELSLERTGLARLRNAVRPLRTPTIRELQADQDDKTMKRLRAMADDLCKRFKLSYRTIDAENEGVTEHYGICYEDGEIRIRLRHARTGRLLKESSLVDTLCHELGHLRHLDHSERFKRLYWKILNEARELGYYQPGPGGTPAQQLDLFADGACGMGRHAR